MISSLLLQISLYIAIAGAFFSLFLGKTPQFLLRFAFISTFLSASFTLVAGILVLSGQEINLILFDTIYGQFGFEVNKLAGFFIIIISLLAIPVSIYSIGYTMEFVGKYSAVKIGFLYNLFYISMILVVIADNAILFLVVWEIMSLVSYLLVVYEHDKKESVASGSLYVIMTHIGTALIMISFLIMASYAGSLQFSRFIQIGSILPSNIRNGIFIMLFIGFGTKAGMVPFHIWLPAAHPAAPSNISALMSGVMIKTGIFMIIRVNFEFLGTPELWWGVLIVIIGGISALIGVMSAVVEKDLKKMLAFSSIENVGLILIALGMALIFLSFDLKNLAFFAIVACLIHVLTHSIFKGLLFMGAGSILFSTHTKNLEQLGGLIKKMPITSIFFFIAVLSVSAIPPFNGFVSEWMIFQSIFQSFIFPSLELKIIMAIIIAILAITGGMVIVVFVRAFAFGFLAMPRSDHAEHAKEVPKTMQIGMGFEALLCFLTGILGPLIIQVLNLIISSQFGLSIPAISNGFILSTINPEFSTSPVILIFTFIVIIAVIVVVFTKKYGGDQKTIIADSWDCGTPLNARNEYTPTAFSNPINKVFVGFYRPDIKINTEPSASPYIFKKKEYNIVAHEPVFEKYLYIPVVQGINFFAERVRRMLNGNIANYLAVIFVTLLIVLIIGVRII
jgi:hydrogenase-4 component B